MNFNFSRSRPRNVFRASSSSRRFWDYVLQPYWDDMNVGIAQDVVQTFSTPRLGLSVDNCNPLPCEVSTGISRLPSESIRPSYSTVHVNWHETFSAHIFTAEVPGLRKEDLTVKIEGAVLHIGGQRSAGQIGANLNDSLRSHLPFVRRFRLPEDAVMDRATAVLDHGVLTLTIPKLQMLPPISWFVPIKGSPSGLVTMPWSEQEQSQPNYREPDNKLMLGSRIESRTHEAAPSSTSRIQNVFLNGENVLAAASEDNGLTSSSRSRSLDVTNEAGVGPNARVTLNININTGKISEGESSSQKLTRASLEEDQDLPPDSKPASSTRSSPLPSRRSSSPQLEDLEGASPPPSPPPALKRKSSVVQMADSTPPASSTVSRRKSSVVRLEDPANEDFDPSPPSPPSEDAIPPASPTALRRKSSAVQMADEEDVASPSVALEEKFKGRNIGRRMTAGDALPESPKPASVLNRRRTVGDTPLNLEISGTGRKKSEGDARSRRGRSVPGRRNTEETQLEKVPEQMLEGRASTSARTGSAERRKTVGDEQREQVQDRRASTRKASLHTERRRSAAPGKRGSILRQSRATTEEDSLPAERRGSAKRGSVGGERRASLRKDSVVGERRESTKGASIVAERRPSVRSDRNGETPGLESGEDELRSNPGDQELDSLGDPEEQPED